MWDAASRHWGQQVQGTVDKGLGLCSSQVWRLREGREGVRGHPLPAEGHMLLSSSPLGQQAQVLLE